MRSLAVEFGDIDDIDASVCDAVLNIDGFWRPVKSAHTCLQPIATCIAKVKSDESTISDVPHCFGLLRKAFDALLASSVLTAAKQQIALLKMQKFCDFCCTPLNNAANSLDPRHRGSSLNDEEKQAAITTVIKYGKACQAADAGFGFDEPAALADGGNYITADNFYNDQARWDAAKHELISPATWWKSLCSTQALRPIAVRLLSVSSSSASLECVFSVFSHVHTLQRYLLSHECVQKIVAIGAASHADRLRKRPRNPRAAVLNESESNTESSSATGNESSSEILGVRLRLTGRRVIQSNSNSEPVPAN